VASFLLNEKRTEIAKIELKQRINVLMVPNKSLETPNYRLERLKHDDPRLDNIEASYKMADEVEEATAVTRRSQEPTNRQTPVIKGVLPDAPAPVAVPKPEPVKHAPTTHTEKPVAAAPVVAEKGFFGWLKSLFGASPEAAPAAPVAPPAAKDETRAPRENRPGRDGARRPEGRGESRPEGRGPRNEGRTGRGEGRNDNRGNRTGRPDRNSAGKDRTEVQSSFDAGNANLDLSTAPEAAGRGEQRTERGGRNAERGDRPPRTERGGRNERRPERSPRPEEAPRTDTADVNVAAEIEESSATPADQGSADSTMRDENGAPREKRSRDRYGRDRKPRAERGERSESPTQPNQEPQATDATAEQEPVRKSYFSVPAAGSQPEALVAAPAMPTPTPAAVAVTPEPESLPPVMAVQAVAPSVVVAVPAPVAVVASAAVVAPAASAPAAPTKAMPAVQAFALPLDELAQVAESSGLQWVQSDATKVAMVQSAIAAAPKPVHVPRQRAPLPVLDDQPLVLVETKRDLRDQKLPFEQTEAA
jgi:ribonuclease E